MRLRVLGSSGAEFPGHSPPAFLIDASVLLDAGTIGAALYEDEQWKIRHILLTHAHLDHIKGIPFLADNLVLKNKKHGVTVMGLAETLAALKKNLLNDSIWPDFTAIPNRRNPVLALRAIRPGRPFVLNGYRVSAHEVTHSVPALGYVVESPEGRRLLYTGDTGPTVPLWDEAPVDCAIIEVSMPNSMRRMAVLTGHLTAALLREELRKMPRLPGRILVTHPKPQHLGRIEAEVKKLGLPNVSILRGGEEFII